jgi:phage-related minor tail protein
MGDALIVILRGTGNALIKIGKIIDSFIILFKKIYEWTAKISREIKSWKYMMPSWAKKFFGVDDKTREQWLAEQAALDAKDQQIDEAAKAANSIKTTGGLKPASDSGVVKENTDYIKENAKQIDLLYKSIGSTIKTGVVDAIRGAVDGTKRLGDVAAGVLRNIAESLLQMGVQTMFAGMFPGSKVWGKMFRADGGPVKGGNPYIVGERGPELFVPGRSGTVVPNGGGGGINVNVNVDASGSNVEGDADTSKELGAMLGMAVQQEIIKQKRPGGLLAVLP